MESQQAPRIFLTGATGYVGGEALHQIQHEQALQKATVTCLVRDSRKGDIIKQAYPQVNILIGDLDDEATIKREASNSDIVINLASFKHLKSAQAIVQGLQEHASANPSKNVFWIQISGATLLASDEIKQSKFGEHSDKVWNGLDGAAEVESVIRNNPGREVDNLALTARSENLNVALIVGPLIYGEGNGPVNKRSMQAPDMARYILSKGHGFQLNAGLSRWSTIHVGDVGSLIAKLTVCAATVDAPPAGSGLWNESGLYLPETGVMSFHDLSKEIVKESHRQNRVSKPDAEVKIDAAEADKITSHGSILLGTNAVLDFSHAQKVPGWKAERETLLQTVKGLVSDEAASLKKAE